MNILLSGCRLTVLCILIALPALCLPKANAQSTYKGLPVFVAPQSTNTGDFPLGGTSTFVLTIPLNYYNQGRPNAWGANGSETTWQANLGPNITEYRAWNMSVTLESEIPGVSATVLIKGIGIFPSGLVALQVSSPVGWTATGRSGRYACYLNWGVEPKINSNDNVSW